MKEITYKEVLDRLVYFRKNAKMKSGETSEKLGYNSQFLKRIENGTHELKVSTLLNFCEVIGISIYDFFYLGTNYNENTKEFLDTFSSLSDEKQKCILQTMKYMKK